MALTQMETIILERKCDSLVQSLFEMRPVLSLAIPYHTIYMDIWSMAPSFIPHLHRILCACYACHEAISGNPIHPTLDSGANKQSKQK